MFAPFTLSLNRLNNRAWQCSVAGDVDYDSSPRLRAAVQEALDGDVDGLIMDFREVRYLDSSGMTVLLMAHRALAKRKGRFAVIAASGAVTQVLRVTGLLELIAVSPDLDTLRQTDAWADLLSPSP